MRTFLGVDQSLRGTGLVVLSETGDILLQRLVQPSSLRGVERLAFIRGELREVLERHQPYRAALEGYSYDSTGRVFQLGELGGLVQLAFWDAGVPYLMVPPASLKKFVANNGKAEKEQMLKATLSKWHVDFQEEDDLCDAHGLAQIQRTIACDDSTARHELEVIRELLAPPKKPAGATKATRSKVTVSL
jgi:Holliday junction resolvasome RuvABC endonuclease subunit